jgi:hypothetical protein
VVKKSIYFLINSVPYVLFTLMAIFCVINFVKPVSKSTMYSYENLPEKYKIILNEYEAEAKIYNKDVSIVKDLKYIIFNEPHLQWAGFGLRTTKTIFINEDRQNFSSLKFLMWHELGHVVLNYGHDSKRISSHIMGNEEIVYIPWEQRKKQYFSEVMPRNHIENSMKALTSNNYALKYYK